jgi:hypothetical protein
MSELEIYKELVIAQDKYITLLEHAVSSMSGFMHVHKFVNNDEEAYLNGIKIRDEIKNFKKLLS